MGMQGSAALDIASRYAQTTVAGDFEGFANLHAPNSVTWRNLDGASRTVEETVAELQGLHAVIAAVEYDEVRRRALTDGYVDQHVSVLTLHDGTSFRVPGCYVATVDNTKIVRLDEYLDGAALSPLLERMTPR